MQTLSKELEYLRDYRKSNFNGAFIEEIRHIQEGFKNRPDLKERVLNLSISVKNSAFNTHSHLTDIGIHLCRLGREIESIGREIIEAHKIEKTLDLPTIP
jgi:hypothetical protein